MSDIPGELHCHDSPRQCPPDPLPGCVAATQLTPEETFPRDTTSTPLKLVDDQGESSRKHVADGRRQAVDHFIEFGLGDIERWSE